MHAPHLFSVPRLRRSIPVLLLVVLAGGAACAEERQHHGVAFEAWVRETFFEGYEPADPTQKWDIPAAVNTRHGHIPVNPKAVKYPTTVDLGDALRQFGIETPFWLVLGYWESEGGHKKIVNITAIRVELAGWRKLWGDISQEDLERLDALIKDRSLSAEEVRRRAHALNATPPYSEAIIRLNPKIDTKGQRRLQCSLTFSHLFDALAPDADRGRQDDPALWGVSFPGPLE